MPDLITPGRLGEILSDIVGVYEHGEEPRHALPSIAEMTAALYTLTSNQAALQGGAEEHAAAAVEEMRADDLRRLESSAWREVWRKLGQSDECGAGTEEDVLRLVGDLRAQEDKRDELRQDVLAARRERDEALATIARREKVHKHAVQPLLEDYSATLRALTGAKEGEDIEIVSAVPLVDDLRAKLAEANDVAERMVGVHGALEKARAEVERLHSILHRSYMKLPLVPGSQLAWVDHDLEPHVTAVADDWAIRERQLAAERAKVDRLLGLLREVEDFGIFDANNMRGFDEWLERVERALDRAQAQEGGRG